MSEQAVPNIRATFVRQKDIFRPNEAEIESYNSSWQIHEF